MLKEDEKDEIVKKLGGIKVEKNQQVRGWLKKK